MAVIANASRAAERGPGPGAARSSLMNVGRRVDYALRALSYLAAQPADRVVTRTEIQEQQAVPARG